MRGCSARFACSLRSSAVTGPRRSSNIEAAYRLNVNFQIARHRIEALTHYSKMIRARALAAYVGVFDFADEDGLVEASSEEIAAEFEIGRSSWLHYRALLEEAGLLGCPRQSVHRALAPFGLPQAMKHTSADRDRGRTHVVGPD
jgi:hypothetical protein